MIPPEFDYFAPSSVQEAVSLLAQHSGAKILAGGQSLIPAMRFRLATPPTIIDLNNVTALQYVREDKGTLAIGALTRESEIEDSDVVARSYHLLADASRMIADPAVRN